MVARSTLIEDHFARFCSADSFIITMDYSEEQAQELEILTSIYTEDEFERILPAERFSYS